MTKNILRFILTLLTLAIIFEPESEKNMTATKQQAIEAGKEMMSKSTPSPMPFGSSAIPDGKGKK